MLESLTFLLAILLAILGYTGLTLTAVALAWGRFPVSFWRGGAGVIALHVALVWSVRYEWQLGEATRNGYGGFLLFHTALLAILGSVFVPLGEVLLARVSAKDEVKGSPLYVSRTSDGTLPVTGP